MHEPERTDAGLFQGEQQFQELLQALRVGIVVHAPDTTIRFSNPEASRLLGLTPEQLQGKDAVDPAWKFVNADGSVMVYEDYPVNRVVASLRPLREYVVGVDRSATADRIWVLVHAYPEFTASHELLNVVVTFVDISARKRAEEALQKSESIFSYFMAYSPIHVFFKDENLRALRLSKNFETMLGKPLAELLGKNMDELFPSDLAKKIMADDMRIMQDGKNVTVEEEFNGRFYSTTKFPIRVDGIPRYLAGFTVDITQRKREAEEKEHLQADLAQALKMESVGRLAGGVAHDFNNMLMGVMGYAELCRDELPADHRAQHYLKELTNTAKRSADLTRQLLAFARKQPIAPESLDLNDVIAGMLKLLRRLIGENVDLTWMPAAKLWTVRLDPTQLDQILVNLCVNARDAIGTTGCVAVASANAILDRAYCTTHAGAVPGEYVLLTVRDNGCGVAPDALAHIFEPFYTTKGVGKGTGLGLATVYGIIRQNHGHIAVRNNEPEPGATFEIYLPRFSGAEEVSVDADPSASPSSRSETVLLVEDEKAPRDACDHFLKSLGYTTLVAASPAEAQRLFAQHQKAIDLLLTDVVMPGMNGQELAKQLTADKPDLKILYMSGYAADVIIDQETGGEGFFFLGKPFLRDDLARKLREVFGEDMGPGPA